MTSGHQPSAARAAVAVDNDDEGNGRSEEQPEGEGRARRSGSASVASLVAWKAQSRDFKTAAGKPACSNGLSKEQLKGGGAGWHSGSASVASVSARKGSNASGAPSSQANVHEPPQQQATPGRAGTELQLPQRKQQQEQHSVLGIPSDPEDDMLCLLQLHAPNQDLHQLSLLSEHIKQGLVQEVFALLHTHSRLKQEPSEQDRLFTLAFTLLCGDVSVGRACCP
eukprot:1161670-Pelagomonas_calceolata.AAC.22